MIDAPPPPKPIIKLGPACYAKAISRTIRLGGKTIHLSRIEICGKKVILRGKVVR